MHALGFDTPLSQGRGAGGEGKQETKQRGAGGSVLTVSIPHRRSHKDISIPQDLIEEIARIYGYENITPKAISHTISYHPTHPTIMLTRQIEETLVKDCHVDQLETYPRVEEDTLDIFGIDKTKLISLQNAVTPETKYMRDSLTYNLLAAVKKNHKFLSDFFLFDIGKTRKKMKNEKPAHQGTTGG